jgi:peptide/nickel transport system ATP-binding protein
MNARPGPHDAQAIGAASALSVAGLTVEFTVAGVTRRAVDDVSFDISPGETVAVVGESGSGKSTTVAAILGVLAAGGRVASGRVLIGGRNIVGLSESQMRAIRGKEVALVPQDPMSNLDPVMRIGAQVNETVTAHRKLARSQVRAEAISALSQAGLLDPERRLRQYPHEFSGGMRQRVLIAIGLANQPRLLIADEPTSALDVTVQRRILDHLAALVDGTGTAVLFITHDLGLAAERADRLIVMKSGRIVEQGGALEVLRNPQHHYTNALIAAVPSTTTATDRRPETQSDDPPLLRAENLVKRYHVRGQRAGTEIAALDDVSFSVARGRTLAVVGESGSGKSTAASIVLRLIEPTSGRVVFDGLDVTHRRGARLREFRRKVQPIFQDPYASLDPMFTIERILTEPLRAFSIGDASSRRGRAREMMEQVSLPVSMLNRHPSELSGGQRQRVAIARALATRPELVVCDEPVSALDVLVQAQILDLLASLQEQLGLSYLFISHDLGVIRAVADEVAVMSAGRIVEHGTARQIFDDPQQEYTRDLLAAIPGRTLLADRATG